MWEGRFHTHVIHQVQLWFCITALIKTNLPDGFPLPFRLVSVMCESPSLRTPFTAPVTVSLVCVLINPAGIALRPPLLYSVERLDVEGSSQDPTKGTTLPRHQPRRTQKSRNTCHNSRWPHPRWPLSRLAGRFTSVAACYSLSKRLRLSAAHLAPLRTVRWQTPLVIQCWGRQFLLRHRFWGPTTFVFKLYRRKFLCG